jgi:dihydroflavonol-4-reductase
MRVLVTGGTGLLGRNIIPFLVGNGHQVIALVRSAEKARDFIAEAVELVQGDLAAPESYANSLVDIEAVIHAGACYSEFYRSNRSKEQLVDVNVKGTLALLETCRERGVRRFVYVSSAGVLDTKEGEATDESAAYSKANDGPYFESKIEAEKTALHFAEEHPDMHLVVLLPTVMIGPNDTGPTPTGAVLKRLADGELNIVFPGAMNLVDARDVAAAAVTALGRGEHGARYLLGGSRHSVKDIFVKVSAAAGRPAPSKAPPPAMLKFILAMRGMVAKLQGKRPPLRPADINRLQRDFWFSSAKAEQDLGLRMRPMQETLTDTAHWFAQQTVADGGAVAARR